MRRYLGTRVVLGLLVLGLSTVAIGGIPTAFAATSTINGSASCSSIGGSWGGTTCTLTTSYTVSSGNKLEVASGTTLLISGSGKITVASGGSIQVDSGAFLTVENSGSTNGISNSGTLTNSGTITIEDSGASTGIYNSLGTVTNSGTMTIENSGLTSEGIFNGGGSLTNSGTITIENIGTDSYGFYNSFGTWTNSGTITIENDGTGSYGIYDDGGSVATNDCSGQITIEPATGTGFDNAGSFVNSGTITGTIVGNAATAGSACSRIGVPQFQLGLPLLFVLAVPALLLLSRMNRRQRLPSLE